MTDAATPITDALDLLGRRCALRLLWELRLGPLNFRALQQACETNPAVLNSRLKELRAGALVDHEEGGYRLTVLGQELLAMLEPQQGAFAAWALKWRRKAE